MTLMKYLSVLVLILCFITFAVNATQEQVRVTLNEYVDQEVYYNPLEGQSGIWVDANENRSLYNATGDIIVSNENPNGKTISDIYVSFDYTTNMTVPTLTNGRSGTLLDSSVEANTLVIHIPELQAGENSTWSYSINTTNIKPPLNFTTSYSDTKVLAGSNFSITDTIQNVFTNATYQGDTCINNINITGNTLPVDFSGTPQDFYYLPSTLGGSDSGNVVFSNSNKTSHWNVFGGGCLNKSSSTDISYDISTPVNIPSTESYNFINTTLRYQLNQTLSQLRVVDITGVSEGRLSFEKKIEKPSHPTLYGSNVTWNVTGYFNTDTNITYNLSSATFWVAQRNGTPNPNIIDDDPISNESLEVNYTPNQLVNVSSPWTSQGWQFNYSDLPSPVVFQDINFSIYDDGTQLVNRSVTRNGDDIYIKEIYLIIGYWLEIDKNITSIGNDSYNVRIDVHNKGNQVTPADSVVTIYDFVPEDFNITSNFTYSSSPWYSTIKSENNITGEYNGTLIQWGLSPTNSLNTSLGQGPSKNQNTTWSAEFNVTGQGDYDIVDVFVTGLDPQKVDGAGSTQTTVVTEVIDRVGSTEAWFALSAGVLLVLGLII